MALTQEELAAITASIVAGIGGGSDNTATTSTSKDLVKLTPIAAKALLEQTSSDIQYTGKFSKEDIQAFVDKFNEEATKQVETVVKQARSQTKAGATATDIQNTIQSILSTTSLTFFSPKDYAKDYIWSKVNFKDETTLAGKSLTALQQVRQLAKDMNILSFSDAEIQAEAKKIAMGSKSISDLTSELTQKAIIEYPTLADRFKATPGLTTRDVASPVIDLISKYWEVPKDTITLDDPMIQSWLRPGGADGKQPAMTYSEIMTRIKNDPKTESTTWKNEFARQSATSLARALGAGV